MAPKIACCTCLVGMTFCPMDKVRIGLAIVLKSNIAGRSMMGTRMVIRVLLVVVRMGCRMDIHHGKRRPRLELRVVERQM